MNPTNTPLKNEATGVVATPNENTTAAQMSAAQNQGFSTTTIAADGLGGVKSVPVTIPTANKTTPSPTPSANPPSGVTLDANGNATVPLPPPTATPNDTQSWIKTQLKDLGSALSGRSQATLDANTAAGVDEKTMKATASYNAYNQAKLALQQRSDALLNQKGISGEAARQNASEEVRLGNANLANLAVVAQADQGLLDAAKATVENKIKAQFDPITEQIDFLTKFSQVNSNDLTESQKAELSAKIDKQRTDSANLQKISSDLHQAIIDNGANSTTLAALDSVTNDYVNGRITAEDAQNKMYAAAGKYGVDQSKLTDIEYKRAQINKINNDIKQSGVPQVTNPDAAKYGTALSVILGSAKFTAEQKKSIVNSINNGGDPFAVIKNQAKNIMGQAEATTLTKYEVAKDTLSQIGTQLADFYANGGSTNIFSGNFQKIVNKLGEVNDPKLANLATQIQGNLQVYRNAISGTAYSQQEGQDIASIFPGINKSETLNTAILKGRSTLFDSIIDSTYRSALGNTYDDLKSSNNITPGEINPKSQSIGATFTYKGQQIKKTGADSYEIVGTSSPAVTSSPLVTTPAKTTPTSPFVKGKASDPLTIPVFGSFTGFNFFK